MAKDSYKSRLKQARNEVDTYLRLGALDDSVLEDIAHDFYVKLKDLQEPQDNSRVRLYPADDKECL